MTVYEEILAHALDTYPEECCGLVAARGTHTRVIRGKNVSSSPLKTFDLGVEAWLEVADDEEVVAIYHSHPRGSSEPSEADRVSCEATGLPWYILGVPDRHLNRIEPCGYEAPLEGRPYVYGVHDCYTLVRDWYKREEGIELPYFESKEGWWDTGQNLFLDNFKAVGFEEVEGDPQHGDVFLFLARARVPNHLGVYLHPGQLLHHVGGRLSRIESWAGYWPQHRWSTLRHYSKKGTTHHG